MAPAELMETQGKDAFIDALVNLDTRLRIKQNRLENTDDWTTCNYCKEKNTFVGIVQNLKIKKQIKIVMHQRRKMAGRICSEHRGCFAQGHVGGGTTNNESGIFVEAEINRVW